jgi:hypothetical protein
MPLELGLFLGCHRFGTGWQREKVCMILDVEPNRYQKFISDIAGQDICSHGGKPETAIKLVRNWLKTCSRRTVFVPSAGTIQKRYASFEAELPQICEELDVDPELESMLFADFSHLLTEWLKQHPLSLPKPRT